jgi:hypothetical protein
MPQVNGNSGAASGLGPQVCGVWGDSHDDRGVVGTSHAANGVLGQSDRRSGVWGIGDLRPGVHGTSENSDGVSGESAARAGVRGQGQTSGVQGVCLTASDSRDQNRGVSGEAADVGVYGSGFFGLLGQTTDLTSGRAGRFDGPVDVNGALQVDGPISTAYAAKTTTYTIAATDSVIDCTSGTFTVTLPTAASITGRMYTIKNSGAGVITVGTTSSQTIDGSTTYSLGSQYKYVVVVSNGSSWIVVGNN